VWSASAAFLLLRHWILADCGPWWDPLTWGCQISNAVGPALGSFDTWLQNLPNLIASDLGSAADSALQAIVNELIALGLGLLSILQSAITGFLSAVTSVLTGFSADVSSNLAPLGPLAPIVVVLVLGLAAVVLFVVVYFVAIFVIAAFKTAFNLL
jgi:hypothetical protein